MEQTYSSGGTLSAIQIQDAINRSSVKPEEILSNEVNIDTPKKLNRSEAKVPIDIINEIETKGMSLERLISLGLPIYKYQTQITVHGNFDGLTKERVGGYKNLTLNQNKTLGIRYNAIDAEKKKIISKALYLDRVYNEDESKDRFTSDMDSKGFTVSKSKITTDKSKAIEIANQFKAEASALSHNFIGNKYVNIYSIYGMYLIKYEIHLNAINQAYLWNFISSITDGRIIADSFVKLLKLQEEKEAKDKLEREKKSEERENLAKEKALELKSQSPYNIITELPKTDEFAVAIVPDSSYSEPEIKVFYIFKNKQNRRVFRIKRYKNWSDVQPTINKEPTYSEKNNMMGDKELKMLADRVAKGGHYLISEVKPILVIEEKKSLKHDSNKFSDYIYSNDEYEFQETKHTKTNDTIYVLRVKKRLTPTEYKTVESNVKLIRGYYSGYVKGFVLKSKITQSEIERLFKGTSLDKSIEVKGEEKLMDDRLKNKNTGSLFKGETWEYLVNQVSDYFLKTFNKPILLVNKSNTLSLNFSKSYGEEDINSFLSDYKEYPTAEIYIQASGYKTKLPDFASEYLYQVLQKNNKSEILIGGKGDNKTIEDIADMHNVSVEYAKEQLNKGIDIESEHTNDVDKATEIALDHLTEFINYYVELKKMETKLEENESNEKIVEEEVKETFASDNNVIENLIPKIDSKLRDELSDFKVTEIFIKDGELHVTSEYDVPMDYIEAIKKDLSIKKSEENYEFNEGDYVYIIDEPITNTQNLYKVIGHQNYNKNFGWETTIKNFYTDETVTMFENLLGYSNRDEFIKAIIKDLKESFKDIDEPMLDLHLKVRLEAIDRENELNRVKEQYPIVIEWSESGIGRNIGLNNLDELNDKLKQAGFSSTPTQTYVKNKVWFRGYPHYTMIDNSKASDSDFDFEKEHVRDYLKKYDKNFDFSIFDVNKKDDTTEKSNEIEDLEMLIELTQESVNENPNDEDLSLYLEMLKETLSNLKS
jgi:hypothetical protein